MIDDPEAQLRQILRDRADTITTAPDYRTTPEVPFRDRSRRAGAPRPSIRSWQLSTALLGAAVVVLVTIIVLPSHRDRHTPVHTSATCAAGRSAAFRAAMSAGRLGAVNQVLAGAPNGAELVAPTNGLSMPDVSLAAPDGDLTQLWQQRPGGLSLAIANPSGAIGSVVVAFALAPIDPSSGSPSTTTRTVLAASRGGGKAEALPAPDPGFVVSATNPLTAPVAGGGTVTVLEQSRSQPSKQRLVMYASRPWRRVSSETVSRVVQLVPVGGILLMVRRTPHGVELTSPHGNQLPAGLESAARNGRSFSSDGVTLTWFARAGSAAAVWSWRPGDATPVEQPLPVGFVPQLAGGGVVVGRFDRTVARISVIAPGHPTAELPADISVIRIDEHFAVLDTLDKTIIRVPLSSLTDCRP
jgi:hypothetical protein